MVERSEDLELQDDQAEQVVGGTNKKKAQKTSAKVVGGGIQSTATPGEPSALSPEPIESYMIGSPEADQ